MGCVIPMRNAGETDWKACVKKASSYLSKKQIKRWKLDLIVDEALEIRFNSGRSVGIRCTWWYNRRMGPIIE